MAQVPTIPTTIRQIMIHPLFEIGVRDARAGRPMHKNFDCWSGNEQWAYERGRAWGTLARKSVPLKRDGRLTREAIDWYDDAIL